MVFWITTRHDWLRKLAPLFHPIRSKTKTIVTRSHTFSRVSRQPRWSNYFEFSVVHRIFFDLCDWSEWLLWCSFYDTQYQTRKTVFQCISKHREESWKYDAQRSIFDELRGVWKCGQTLSWVFDESSQSRKRRNKIVNIYSNLKIRYPNIVTVLVSF